MHSLLVAGIFAGIFVRALRMSGESTPPLAIWQHRLTLILATASAPIFDLGAWSPVLLAGALCAYLMLDNRRSFFRGSPPSAFDESELHHVTGGRQRN